jgi:selenocysteine lyase/cysteine desulfurase
VIALDELASTPNALAPHYSRFRVAERLLLTGHSHQAWPDVAREAQVEAFDDAADCIDGKWERAEAKADEVRAGFGQLLGGGGGGRVGDIALGASTHDLLVRFLSALDLVRRPRLVTSDGEFHSLRRQLARLAEAGVAVEWVPASPADTLAERLADAVDDRTSAVLVSAVLFSTARIVPGLGALADACARRGVELLVDAYHALGVLPLPVADMGLGSAWIVGGGYKYLQLGEGNCFLRLPPQASRMRPVVTGWFAEFDSLESSGSPSRVTYAPGAARFAGATYDPTSHYRAARVFRFFAEHGLTPPFLREVYAHQLAVLARCFDALDAPESLITRDRTAPLSAYAGFLALRTPLGRRLQQALLERGIHTDTRGPYLRLGPAPYLTDPQLESAIATLAPLLPPPTNPGQ